MPDGKIELTDGKRGADATLVLNFGEAGIVEAIAATGDGMGGT